jgi:hypothetical protein
MDISDKSPNKTLSSEVTRDIVKRAKEAGVNVSGIISQLQRALAAQGNEGNTANDFESTYKKLFKAMRRIMHPYRVMVEIGNDNSCPLGDRVPINLTLAGIHTSGQGPFYGVPDDIYEPQKIVHNLISALTQVAEANKQKIDGLGLALRSVKSLADDIGNEELSQSEVTV